MLNQTQNETLKLRLNKNILHQLKLTSFWVLNFSTFFFFLKKPYRS